jgi:hypothetical protein
MLQKQLQYRHVIVLAAVIAIGLAHNRIGNGFGDDTDHGSMKRRVADMVTQSGINLFGLQQHANDRCVQLAAGIVQRRAAVLVLRIDKVLDSHALDTRSLSGGLWLCARVLVLDLLHAIQQQPNHTDIADATGAHQWRPL